MLSIKDAARRAQLAAAAAPSTLDPAQTAGSELSLGLGDQDNAATTRHPELWFPDGSVILSAQGKLFRVHISVLSRHSAFFRDMFSLPQPAALPHPSPTVTQDDANGCPLVHLHDTAEDLASLLFALYDGPIFGNNDQADFRVASGILRLASKYLIDSLRTKALDHLSKAWPATLKGWDAREDLAGEYYVDVEAQRYYPSPVQVVNLAREVNAPSLLPAAFYDLSRYQLSAIFDGHGGVGGSTQLGLGALSLPDTQKLVLGKEAAQYAVTALIRGMATQPHHPQQGYPASGPAPGGAPGHNHAQAPPARHPNPHNTTAASAHLRHRRMGSCASAAACRRDVSELVDLATQHYLFDRERGASDPLYVAEELGLLKGAEMEGSECKACGRALEVWAAKERERLWRAIPGWFKLDVGM